MMLRSITMIDVAKTIIRIIIYLFKACMVKIVKD